MQKLNHALTMFSELKDFSDVTGIPMYNLREIETNRFSVCAECPYYNKCDLFKNIWQLSNITVGNVWFCSAGFFYMYVTPDNTCIYVSAPISCVSRHHNFCLQNQQVISLLPTKISKTSRLLKTLFNNSIKIDWFNELYEKLQLSLFNHDCHLVHPTFENFFELVLQKNGLDVDVIKLSCIRFIFMLFEFSEIIPKTANIESYQFQWNFLFTANTIGKLKECILLVETDFINSYFQSTCIKQNEAIYEAIQLIHQNFHKSITQISVANAVYLSASYFSKTFKETTGITFTQYLNTVRIDHAKAQLKQPEIPIDKIYKTVGYKHRSYFGKIFLKLTGTTPKKYRNQFLSEK